MLGASSRTLAAPAQNVLDAPGEFRRSPPPCSGSPASWSPAPRVRPTPAALSPVDAHDDQLTAHGSEHTAAPCTMSALPPRAEDGVLALTASSVIDAPIDTVWGILLDFPSYPEW